MFRFVLSAVALAGVLATAHPVFADRVAADPAQAAAAVTQQAPVSLWSSDATAPATGLGKNVAPAGFGWG
jgi:hypothetical protein